MSELIVTSGPHIRHGERVSDQMRDVIIALVPALAAAVYYFGMNAVLVIGSTVAAAVIFEIIMVLARRRSPFLKASI